MRQSLVRWLTARCLKPNKDRMVVLMVLIFVVIMVFQNGISSAGGKDCLPAQSTTERSQRMRELEQAGHKLVKAIRERDVKSFLDLLSKRGFGFEPDNDFTFEQVKYSLENKTSTYCWLFDSECLTKYYPEYRETHSLYSVHEVFSRGEGLQTRRYFSQPGGPGTPEDTCFGEIIIEWNGKAEESLHGIPFSFAYEKDTWRLTGLDDFFNELMVDKD